MNEFQAILPNLPNDLKHLVRSWKEHLEVTTDLLVQTRIMIRRDQKRLLGLNWLFPRKLKAITQRSIKTEKLKLQQEVEKIRKQSQKKDRKDQWFGLLTNFIGTVIE